MKLNLIIIRFALPIIFFNFTLLFCPRSILLTIWKIDRDHCVSESLGIQIIKFYRDLFYEIKLYKFYLYSYFV